MSVEKKKKNGELESTGKKRVGGRGEKKDESQREKTEDKKNEMK